MVARLAINILECWRIDLRIRSCGAVLHNEQILMVRHIHDGRDYWTLPGGGIEEGESPEGAAEREVLEETGLTVTTSKFLFTTTSGVGTKSYCFLMNTPDNPLDIFIGVDPEQEHLEPSMRMLQGVQWHSLDSMRTDLQVSRVIESLNKGHTT